MAVSFVQVLICLLAGIGLIVILTASYPVHAFFALLAACFAVGFGVQMPAANIIDSVKEGFGGIIKSLGLIIVLGTTPGVILEHTGSTKVMADFILKKVGEKHAPLAMSITGVIVGLPIFCDSGFIVLSGLNRSLATRTGICIVITSVSLAAGLYAIHCLIPPHPGAAAAAGALGVDFGQLILTGIITALPAMIVGYWAGYAGKKVPAPVVEEEIIAEAILRPPSVIKAFLPVIIPIILIALKSFLVIKKSAGGWPDIFSTLGDPVIALAIGVLLAFNCSRSWTRSSVSKQLQEAAEKKQGAF